MSFFRTAKGAIKTSTKLINLPPKSSKIPQSCPLTPKKALRIAIDSHGNRSLPNCLIKMKGVEKLEEYTIIYQPAFPKTKEKEGNTGGL